MRLFTLLLIAGILSIFSSCCDRKDTTGAKNEKIRIIIDSDTNNELDDQHAIAYALFNGNVFEVEGITVNRTQNGGDVESQKAEAVRVVKLCGLYPQIGIYKGANGSYEDIVRHIHEPGFDGEEAVNFIIERAKAKSDRKLVIIPVGKLTNIALAIQKAPEIIPEIRVLWLGTNYPDNAPEYNFYNDTSAVNPVLDSGVELGIAVVGGPDGTGTASVRVSTAKIRGVMPGLGPRVEPVEGRHGGTFTNFGDYSVNLFENTKDKYRSLYDVAAYAITKKPEWAVPVVIGAPEFVNGRWVNHPDNPHKITIWDHFDKKKIMDDFFHTMKHYKLVTPP